MTYFFLSCKIIKQIVHGIYIFPNIIIGILIFISIYNNINMTALRSRPLRKHSWQYYFYIEIDGTTDTEDGNKMIAELNNVCDKLKIAGTFAPHSEI